MSKEKYKIFCIGKKSKVKLNDYNKTRRLIKDCDIIIHLASIINPFDKNIWDINVKYTRFLVEEAKRFNKRFIYISTQNVLFGKDAYSETKRHAEDIVKTLKNYVILRPTIIYGRDDERYIGKLIKVVKSYLIIPIIGNGKNRLQPIYIDDLIEIIETCINKKIKGIYLIAGGSVVTYNQLIDLIIKRLRLNRIKIRIPKLMIKPLA